MRFRELEGVTTMNKIMNNCRLVLAIGAMLGFCTIVDAQRRDQDDNNQQGFNQGFGRGNRNFNAGGGRGRRFFNPNTLGIQAAEGDYSIVATKSIFLRDRRDRNVQEGPVYVHPRDLPPEQLLVVTGVVFEEGGFHAFVEHLLQGGITQLKVGDKVREGDREVGEVTEIRMDGFKFRKNGSNEEVFVGVSYNLLGTRVDSIQGERLRLQSLTGGGGGGGNSGFGQRQFGGGGNLNDRGSASGRQIMPIAPAPLDSNTSLSIEERMRMRRLQEGQPGAQQVIVAQPQQAAPQQNDDDDDDAPAAVVPPAQAAPVDVDSLTNLTLEERMRLRRLQESGGQ